MRSSDSSFMCQRILASLTLPPSCLHLFHLLPYLTFNNIEYKTVPTQEATNPVSLPLYFSCRMFLSAFTALDNCSIIWKKYEQLIASFMITENKTRIQIFITRKIKVIIEPGYQTHWESKHDSQPNWTFTQL